MTVTPELIAQIRLGLRNPLIRYQPGPPHEAFLRSPSRFKLLRAPSQSGKTVSGCVFAHSAALGVERFGPTRPVPVYGRIVCHSWRQSLVVQRKLHEMAPEGVLDDDCTFHPSRGYKHGALRYRNGSLTEIVTATQGRLALASATCDWIWIDEPPPADIYAEAVSRLVQTGGTLVMTLTPVGAPLGWLREAVEEGAIEDHHYGLSVANCPWMTQQQVDDAVRACLPSQRPQVIRGEWDGVTPDRMLDGFEPDVCVRPLIDYEGDAQVLLSMDHGTRPGHEVALLVYLWRDHGVPHAHVWDEYSSPGRTTEEQDAMAIASMLDRHGLSLFDVDRARGDINSAGKSHARHSVNANFDLAFRRLAGGRLPFSVERPHKGRGSILRSARVINSALLEERLHIHPRCKRLIGSCMHWRGDDDDHKHPIDALGYGVYDHLDKSLGTVRQIRRA